ncbi:serine/threonine-protein phosphatase PP1-like [Sipha flava]|uniref:Serine/threonine-protein phosphatase n=1 Tax=Sipha flava TaxID=143950 RepID=A0A8B8FIZ4_9HEMI|nr:serine/threonine-protein phosphatase PP1-like [Sipha flava]
MSRRPSLNYDHTGVGGHGHMMEGLLSGAADLSDAHHIRALCMDARRAFLQQPMLLKLRAPIKVVGDLHGQYSDLLRWFEAAGRPPDVDFLFLGDFVDRGPQSVEVITLLLALKTRYPKNVYLLRGNHECCTVNVRYGFYDECRSRYGSMLGGRLWKAFNRTFDCMPVAAVVAGIIFCAHGGLSPHLRYMGQIDRMPRPARVPKSGLMCDLLWSDPSDRPGDRGWRANVRRHVSYEYGADRVAEFLFRFRLKLVVRAHQASEIPLGLATSGLRPVNDCARVSPFLGTPGPGKLFEEIACSRPPIRRVQGNFPISVTRTSTARHISWEKFLSLQETKYFGLILDSTPDRAHRDQFAVVIRYCYKRLVVERFLTYIHILNQTGISMAEKCVDDGYKFFAQRKLVTVFSAPDYRGYGLPGAVMSVDEYAKYILVKTIKSDVLTGFVNR